VFSGDPDQGLVLEDVVLVLREWSPALVLDSMFLQETLGF
jgi:hypothetical protein